MQPVRSSNIERRRLRNECRKKLSKHICKIEQSSIHIYAYPFSGKKLGIAIEPSQVRLIPRAQDPYVWKILPEKRDVLSKMFSKNISDHSIGTYKELCKGVGVTFEAELVTTKISVANEDSITSVNVRRVSRLSRFLTILLDTKAVRGQFQYEDRRT